MNATPQEIEQDAYSRETSQDIMEIIYEMATDMEDVERLWQEPNPIEEISIIRRVTEQIERQHVVCDGDTLHWGEATIDISTGEIS